MKINKFGQEGVERFSFEIKDSEKSKTGVTAFITDWHNPEAPEGDTTQLYDDSALWFEQDMTSAKIEDDLDVICAKYFNQQKLCDALDYANADIS